MIEFPNEYKKWEVNLKQQYMNTKTKAEKASIDFVQGYHHENSNCEVVVVYENQGFKRLGQKIKEKLNFISIRDKVKPVDDCLFFQPIKLSNRKILSQEIFSPVKEFLREMKFDDDPKIFKAQGEHLSVYFKVFVACFDSEDDRRDYLHALNASPWQH